MVERLANITITALDLIIGLGGFVVLFFIDQCICGMAIDYATKLLKNNIFSKLPQQQISEVFKMDDLEDFDDTSNIDDINETDAELDDECIKIPIYKCPMCGKDVATTMKLTDDDGVDWFFMMCDDENGGCGLATAYYDTPVNALMAWNQRKGVN